MYLVIFYYNLTVIYDGNTDSPFLQGTRNSVDSRL